jgi:hypothetical protein
MGGEAMICSFIKREDVCGRYETYHLALRSTFAFDFGELELEFELEVDVRRELRATLPPLVPNASLRVPQSLGATSPHLI